MRFDIVIICWQVHWMADQGRVARDILGSIFFTATVLLIRFTAKVYQAYKQKDKFVDIYVYPWILQVIDKENQEKEHPAGGKPSQALFPDLWLLRHDMETDPDLITQGKKISSSLREHFAKKS